MKDLSFVIEEYLDSMIGKEVNAKYYNSELITGTLTSYNVNPFNCSQVTVVIDGLLRCVTDIGLKR